MEKFAEIFCTPPPSRGYPPKKKVLHLLGNFFRKQNPWKCPTVGAKGTIRKISLMPQRVTKWFFTPCVSTQNTQTFQENSIRDEKHIGPNINTIPKQSAVRVALYLSGKAVVLRLQHPRSKSCCGQYVGTPTLVGTQRRATPPPFFAVQCFDFVPFHGDPREHSGYVAIPPTFGPLRGQGLCSHRGRHPEKRHGSAWVGRHWQGALKHKHHPYRLKWIMETLKSILFAPSKFKRVG